MRGFQANVSSDNNAHLMALASFGAIEYEKSICIVLFIVSFQPIIHGVNNRNIADTVGTATPRSSRGNNNTSWRVDITVQLS